jgi:hypothetical protein
MQTMLAMHRDHLRNNLSCWVFQGLVELPKGRCPLLSQPSSDAVAFGSASEQTVRRSLSLAACPSIRFRVTIELKIIKIGKAAGIILPEKALAHLGAKVGDELAVTVTPHAIELAKK